jgi:hypothetical protein
MYPKFLITAIVPIADGKEEIHLSPRDRRTDASKYRTVWPLTPPHGLAVGETLRIETRYLTGKMFEGR